MSAENHKKIKILVVFGTRPEAIKLAPVCRKLKEASMFELYICNTGQQREMAEKTLTRKATQTFSMRQTRLCGTMALARIKQVIFIIVIRKMWT